MTHNVVQLHLTVFGGGGGVNPQKQNKKSIKCMMMMVMKIVKHKVESVVRH